MYFNIHNPLIKKRLVACEIGSGYLFVFVPFHLPLYYAITILKHLFQRFEKQQQKQHLYQHKNKTINVLPLIMICKVK